MREGTRGHSSGADADDEESQDLRSGTLHVVRVGTTMAGTQTIRYCHQSSVNGLLASLLDRALSRAKQWVALRRQDPSAFHKLVCKRAIERGARNWQMRCQDGVHGPIDKEGCPEIERSKGDL